MKVAKLTKTDDVYGLPVAAVLEDAQSYYLEENDSRHPSNIVDVWPAAELNAAGYAIIDESVIPADHRSTGFTDDFVNGRVVRTHTTELIPFPEKTDPEYADFRRNYSARINNERNRRVALPKGVMLSTGKTFRVDADDNARDRITGLGAVAIAKKGIGNTDPIPFRDFDNVTQSLTNDECIEMGMQVAAQVSAVFQASWALKDAATPTHDIANDANWP